MDYYEKLYQVADNGQIAPECFAIFKREYNKKEQSPHKQAALKYLIRIWLRRDYAVNNEDEDLVTNIFIGILFSY